MEKKTIVFPITEENFPDAWNWIDECRRRSIVRKYVRKISTAVGNLVFFLLMCILLFGYYLQEDGIYFQAFLQTVPVFPRIWGWLLDRVFKQDQGAWGQLCVWAVILWIVPFIVEVICSGIVRLVCRPKAHPMPEGTVQETSVALKAVTEKLAMSKRIKYVGASAWYSAFFLLFAFGLLAWFTVTIGLGPNQDLIYQIQAAMFSPGFYILIVACLFGLPLLNYPLQQLSRLLYILRLPEDLQEQVNTYVLTCDPEKKARLEEEDRILALADEIRKRRAAEQAALMK